MTSAVSSLTELRRLVNQAGFPAWHVHLLKRELNGGHTTERDLDTLDAHEEMTTLTISGLDQKSFEALVTRFGDRLTALHLWKCPRIADFAPFARLGRLTHLAMFWNQRANRLWDFRQTPALRALHFTDFIKLEALEDLATAADTLEVLAFGNANFSRYVVQSLEPLGELRALRSLSFNAKSIGDDRIQPLARLKDLRELDFPAGQFTVDQLAWLRARLPDTVSCPGLCPTRELGQPLSRGGKQLDLLVNGKRMPFLSSTFDARRVEKYTAAFLARVEYFLAHPTAEPGDGKA